jgi:hypothetical protein
LVTDLVEESEDSDTVRLADGGGQVLVGLLETHHVQLEDNRTGHKAISKIIQLIITWEICKWRLLGKTETI